MADNFFKTTLVVIQTILFLYIIGNSEVFFLIYHFGYTVHTIINLFNICVQHYFFFVVFFAIVFAGIYVPIVPLEPFYL